MIKSFKSKALKRYWTENDPSGLPAEHLKRLNIRLSALDAATKPEDMDAPGWRFHALKGDMKGRYAVTVTGNYRLTFAWDDDGPDAIDVDYLDYH